VPEDMFNRNLKLNRINFANNKIAKMSNRMFNNLKNLNYLDIRDNICVNEYFLYANQNFDLIEKNLETCVNGSLNQQFELGKQVGGGQVLEEKFLNFTEDIVKSIEVLRFGFQYFTDHVKNLEKSVEVMEKKIQNLTDEISQTNQYVNYLGVFLRSTGQHS
jgi:tetrahydromethanopterin S-methyltransferase subunit G